MTARDDTSATALVSDPQLAYRMQWREMWWDYVVRMRSTIASVAESRSDLDQTIARLLENCGAMREEMRRCCGDASAGEFGDLMTFHVTLAALLAVEASHDRLEAVASTEAHWRDNAAEITAFLAGINPNISEARMNGLMKEHLHLIKAEAFARVSEGCAGDIDDGDRILGQVAEISDILADGIHSEIHP